MGIRSTSRQTLLGLSGEGELSPRLPPQIRPAALTPGSRIGLVSLSAGAASDYPRRLERGVAQLRALGFDVEIGRHALNCKGYVSDSSRSS
jgi:muramoyltetrapeptide carboxypeptidase LdcA involved in peptidoglycan recycling